MMSSEKESSKVQGSGRKKHRSRSTPRYNEVNKPKKKISSAPSLASIPNTIKLSMLNSGLLPAS